MNVHLFPNVLISLFILSLVYKKKILEFEGNYNMSLDQYKIVQVCIRCQPNPVPWSPHKNIKNTSGHPLVNLQNTDMYPVFIHVVL